MHRVAGPQGPVEDLLGVVDRRLERLRRGLKGRADVRATSAKWAWVEYVLAQGGEAEGLAVIDAVDAGGSYRAYRKAFEGLEKKPKRGLRALTTLAAATTVLDCNGGSDTE